MPATIREEIVVGGQPGDFCTVRHLTLSGDQESIGALLAESAERNDGHQALGMRGQELTPAHLRSATGRRTWLRRSTDRTVVAETVKPSLSSSPRMRK